jgi:large subunit ribosomal protein L28
MSQRCDVCGKGYQAGNRVSHAHNVSHRRWYPNLRRVRARVSGRTARIKVCTRCLRSNRIEKAVSGTSTASR